MSIDATDNTKVQEKDKSNNNFTASPFCFNGDIAEKYGIEEAILIHHFQHWISINKRQDKNFKDGKTWTYQTMDEICATLFFMKNRFKIIHLINSLIKQKVIVKGNYNKTKFDRTVWYAFVNEEEFINPHCAKTHNRTCESELPIPDSKTDSNKEKKDIERNPFGLFIKLSLTEKEALEKEHGKESVDKMIETMNDWIEARGKSPYTNYAAALRNWFKNGAKSHEKTNSNNDLTKKRIEFAIKISTERPNNFFFSNNLLTYTSGNCIEKHFINSEDPFWEKNNLGINIISTKGKNYEDKNTVKKPEEKQKTELDVLIQRSF